MFELYHTLKFSSTVLTFLYTADFFLWPLRIQKTLHYFLKCFVLIDLKMGQLTHQDIGQMQMYVNFYTREFMNEGDSSTYH